MKSGALSKRCKMYKTWSLLIKNIKSNDPIAVCGPYNAQFIVIGDTKSKTSNTLWERYKIQSSLIGNN